MARLPVPCRRCPAGNGGRSFPAEPHQVRCVLRRKWPLFRARQPPPPHRPAANGRPSAFLCRLRRREKQMCTVCGRLCHWHDIKVCRNSASFRSKKKRAGSAAALPALILPMKGFSVVHQLSTPSGRYRRYRPFYRSSRIFPSPADFPALSPAQLRIVFSKTVRISPKGLISFAVRLSVICDSGHLISSQCIYRTYCHR